MIIGCDNMRTVLLVAALGHSAALYAPHSSLRPATHEPRTRRCVMVAPTEEVGADYGELDSWLSGESQEQPEAASVGSSGARKVQSVVTAGPDARQPFFDGRTFSEGAAGEPPTTSLLFLCSRSTHPELRSEG